ncbi:uncharacterized protein BO72DRAFT_502289 [Aspergillus fijiensis CBS 313.89]|uniref:Uncharacterized protein n=1 Tax=Aspergillus fijiensis CBS 313.89 TaxID=1448319 RepID=A0A8G1RGG2_9EURO|nr:uncharacterized protein BO72DRAFT_502289 [Aspergillus fijiensis CBS 313.89]RAK71051.1 hypothetical protein BO72DRAFT_502289 [Aspergillus fijiensis CBS 313.89]
MSDYISFAFMFMLEMYRRLQKRPGTAASSAKVWIDGEIIDEDYSSDRVPDDALAIMPYHIIKATEYLMVFQASTDIQFVCETLGSLCKKWFLQLYQTKNRRTPIWQHLQGSDVPYYRLGDHVWIWKALKGIKEVLIRLESQHDDPAAIDTKSAVLGDFLKLRERMFTLMAEKRGRRQATPANEREQNIYFNSEDLQKEGIKRFTVRNEVFNKRMLSVTRSANETRFLLHSRDTVLYYGALWGFFEDQEDLLHETLEIQTRHEDSLCDEVEWANPLRYGLALLWSLQGYRLTWGNSSGQMSTKEILRRVEQDSRPSASEMSEDLYSTMSFKNRKQELLDETFQVLRRVKDSITGVRTLIDDWRQRESSQGRERPRWTRRDEQRHGMLIRKQTNELAKHDREARDVTRFTYATVFFLPVGLAVSIFSMSGPLDHTAILGMIITAIVALVVTVAFLWLVIRVPTQVYPQSQGIGSPVKVFLARKAGELAHLLGVQDTSKPTNASQDPVDEADTDEKETAQSSHRSMFRGIYDKIAGFSGLRHQHAVQEREGDAQA